jgi:hypothetical protein
MTVEVRTMRNAFQSSAAGRKVILSLFASVAWMLGSASGSIAQVELKTYADAKGYLNVRSLTCGQLAGTFQEDADFLGLWYSGWFNGRGKRHTINIAKTKEGVHNVIAYCKANPDKKVVDSIDAVLKGN